MLIQIIIAALIGLFAGALAGFLIGLFSMQEDDGVANMIMAGALIGFMGGGFLGYVNQQNYVRDQRAAEIGADEYANIRSWKNTSQRIDDEIADASKDGVITRAEADRIWKAVHLYNIANERCLTTDVCPSDGMDEPLKKEPVAADKGSESQ